MHRVHPYLIELISKRDANQLLRRRPARSGRDLPETPAFWTLHVVRGPILAGEIPELSGVDVDELEDVYRSISASVRSPATVPVPADSPQSGPPDPIGPSAAVGPAAEPGR